MLGGVARYRYGALLAGPHYKNYVAEESKAPYLYLSL